MPKKLADKIKTKLNQWFNEPVGDVGIVSDSAKIELKQPNKSFKVPAPAVKATRGRGDKREVPRHEEEFYPRGAAGRREMKGPQGVHKAAMPHKGNRPKYPK
jgi:hypothetical protein